MPNRQNQMPHKKRASRKRPQSTNQQKKQVAQKESNQLGRWLSKDAKPLALAGNTETQQGSGIPQFIKTKQVYFTREILGNGINNPDFHTFRLNSTFDPDETGVGHQPKGRDVMAGIYNDYTVTGCKYNVQFVSASSAKQLVGCLITTNATLGATFDSQNEIMETKSPYNKKRMLYSTTDSVKQEKVGIVGYVPMSKFALATQGSLSDQFTTGVGANPANSVRLHIWCQNEDGSPTAVGGCVARVFLTYYVLYHGVVVATSS